MAHNLMFWCGEWRAGRGSSGGRGGGAAHRRQPGVAVLGAVGGQLLVHDIARDRLPVGRSGCPTAGDSGGDDRLVLVADFLQGLNTSKVFSTTQNPAPVIQGVVGGVAGSLRAMA